MIAVIEKDELSKPHLRIYILDSGPGMPVQKALDGTYRDLDRGRDGSGFKRIRAGLGPDQPWILVSGKENGGEFWDAQAGKIISPFAAAPAKGALFAVHEAGPLD